MRGWGALWGPGCHCPACHWAMLAPGLYGWQKVAPHDGVKMSHQRTVLGKCPGPVGSSSMVTGPQDQGSSTLAGLCSQRKDIPEAAPQGAGRWGEAGATGAAEPSLAALGHSPQRGRANSISWQAQHCHDNWQGAGRRALTWR